MRSHVAGKHHEINDFYTYSYVERDSPMLVMLFENSMFGKTGYARFFLLLVAVMSLLGATTALQSQTVSANFGNRSGATPVIPSGIFSIGGMGSTVQDPTALSRVTAAGLDGTRVWIPLPQIYATSTPNFSYLDREMDTIKAFGLHPLGVIYQTPPSLASSPCLPPSNAWKWGQMAAAVVAHIDQKYPGLMQDYEIWNEPELPSSLCISNATTRLDTYLSMFYEAASAMHAQATADGKAIRTGGPAISQMSLAPTWIPALLKNTATAPYVDFVSFHLYITGQNNINNGMTWSGLYSTTQSSTQGLAHYYHMIEPLVRGGHQPNAASTPIFISEFNDNWAYARDCCRNNEVYGSLWNSLAVTDFLNVVYSGANAVPSQLGYFNSVGQYFCIMGEWNSAMDCNASVLEPYPQFYAYELFASPDYLDLQAGGHMAASVSPASTTAGLSATAFYTGTADSVVIINPTSTWYTSVNVALNNAGLTSGTGTMYLIDQWHGQISSQSVSLKAVSGGYSTAVEVPAYSTVAVSVKGNGAASPPKAVLGVSPVSGTHPLPVYMDSWSSQAGGSAIVGRTIDFGDGHWVNATPAVWHSYTIPGTYTIRLTIRDQNGQLSTASRVVTIH